MWENARQPLRALNETLISSFSWSEKKVKNKYHSLIYYIYVCVCVYENILNIVSIYNKYTHRLLIQFYKFVLELKSHQIF